MKFLHYPTFLLSLLASLTLLNSCDKKKNDPALGKLDLEFANVVGSNPLQLNSTTPYQTPSGDQFTVTTFRYYISNIKLKKADGSEYAQPESYYLVDQNVPDSYKLTIPAIPEGDYTALTFTIGVDSARNVAGVQTGALAPSDMFWNWKTGYIFTKLEGRSPQAPNGALVFHIAGFESPFNTIRTVSPSLNGNLIQIRNARTPKVHVKADVMKMFVGPTTVRFASLYNSMGGPSAVLLANNCAAGMFTVDYVHGN